MSDMPIKVLRELVRLDCETGRLYLRPRSASWFKDGGRPGRSPADRAAAWNRKNAGREILCGFDGKYLAGTLLGKSLRAHIVVFALENGHWPCDLVDHKDANPTNNRPSNLRAATYSQNGQNAKVRFSNGKVSPYKGVTWDKSLGKWRVYINPRPRVRSYVGVFATERAAAEAYDRAAVQNYGDFARLNFPVRECRW